MRFTRAGTYRLFVSTPYVRKEDVVPVYPLQYFELTDAIYTRVFKWDDNCNLISSFYEGYEIKEYNDGIFNDNTKEGDLF